MPLCCCAKVDFSLCHVLVLPVRQVGSTFWMAPEIHRGGKATAASDIFSLQVLMWEVKVFRFAFNTCGGTVVLRFPTPSHASLFILTMAA